MELGLRSMLEETRDEESGAQRVRGRGMVRVRE